jgi:CDP-glucose 4,6-dehydratase
MGKRQSALETLGLMNETFWNGRRVFLTGSTGFKGSWLSLMLHELGARVYGYALAPTTKPALFSMAALNECIELSTIADIRDADALKVAIGKARPEVVIHMAAQPLVRESYADPLSTYSTNVMGTANLLEAVRRVDAVQAVLVVTTDKVYENQGWVWGYRETDPLGGFDPYSSSKACTEIVTSAYRQSFFHPHDYSRHGVAIASARAGNVIGGGDYASDRLVPDIFRAFAANAPILIRNPKATRPWQHVLEPLRGYLMLAKALVERGPDVAPAINFGPQISDAVPVSEIVEMLVSNWQHAAGWSSQPGEHPHEAHALRLDIALACNQLNWLPQLRIKDALDLCCDWQRNINGGMHARDVTLAQIRAYLGEQMPSNTQTTDVIAASN